MRKSCGMFKDKLADDSMIDQEYLSDFVNTFNKNKFENTVPQFQVFLMQHKEYRYANEY